MPKDRERAIRSVSSGVAKEFLRKAKPGILDRFPEVEQRAFADPLARVEMGPVDEAVKITRLILASIAHSVRTRGDAIATALSLADVESSVRDSVSSWLSGRGTGAEAQQVCRGLEGVFTDHPSLIDRVASVSIPPFETEEDKWRPLEERLKQCVLHVENLTRGWVGTGFAVREGGLILTAAHVVGSGAELVVTFRGQYKAQAKVVLLDEENDVALLETTNKREQDALEGAGLTSYRVSIRDADQLRGHHALCLGYHAEEVSPGVRFLSPCPAVARVALFSPVRDVEFRENGGSARVQPCLTLTISEGGETIREGMSGGPILDLATSNEKIIEIIAMNTGAQRPGRVHQPYGKSESLPIAEYGFGVLFQNVSNSWAGFRECCLKQGTQ